MAHFLKLKFTSKILLAIALSVSSSAFAWGGDGHKTIGAVADQILAGSPTSEKLKTLLKPGETLSSISTWADCAKGYTYCQTNRTPEQRIFVNENPEQKNTTIRMFLSRAKATARLLMEQQITMSSKF